MNLDKCEGAALGVWPAAFSVLPLLRSQQIRPDFALSCN